MGDNTSGLLYDAANDGGENGTGACAATAAAAAAGGEGTSLSLAHPYRRRLPRFLRPEVDEGSAPPVGTGTGAGAGAGAGATSSLSSSACSSGSSTSSLGRRAAAGGGGGSCGNAEGGPGLFVPLLGTRLDPHRQGLSGKMHGDGVGGEKVDRRPVTPEAGGGGGGSGGDGAPALSPSRFTWRWMGLRPAEAEATTKTTTTATTASPLRSPVPFSGRLPDHQHLPREGGGGGSGDGNLGLQRFGSLNQHRDHYHDHVLSPPPAFGAVPAAADSGVGASPPSLRGYPRTHVGAGGGGGGENSIARAPGSSGFRHPSDRFGDDVGGGGGGGGGGDGASFAAGSDDLRRPLPRPMPFAVPSNSTAQSSSSSSMAEEGISASYNVQQRPAAARGARLPSSSSAGINPSRARTGSKTTVAVRRLGGVQHVAVAGVGRGAAEHRGGAAGDAMGGEDGEEDKGYGVRAMRAAGSGGGRLDEAAAAAALVAADAGAAAAAAAAAAAVFAGASPAGAPAATPASLMSSSPTSSSSFSLNGFEVIDSEDMWN